MSSARQLAAECVQKAQEKYKRNYDKTAVSITLRTGQWVLVRFPQDEQGKNRKLSRPWHGPYRVTSIRDPDVSVAKVYFPQDSVIQVHQSRVKSCPPDFPAGFYWYGGKRRGPGRPPKWVSALLNQEESEPKNNIGEEKDSTDGAVDDLIRMHDSTEVARSQPKVPGSAESHKTVKPQKTVKWKEPIETVTRIEPQNTVTSTRPAPRYNLRNQSRHRSGRTQ